jgi:ribosome-binding protein aMBF1 (putative translation factor)
MTDRELLSPIGTPAAVASERRAARSERYRAQREDRAAFREVAWLLIKYRMENGLTQQELADRVGTSYSQISRIESGRHTVSIDTLRRVSHALGLKLILGFERQEVDEEPHREFVAL